MNNCFNEVFEFFNIFFFFTSFKVFEMKRKKRKGKIIESYMRFHISLIIRKKERSDNKN